MDARSSAKAFVLIVVFAASQDMQSAKGDLSNKTHILMGQPRVSSRGTLKILPQEDSSPLGELLQCMPQNDFHKRRHCKTSMPIMQQ